MTVDKAANYDRLLAIYAKAERATEALIDFLDQLAGDPDLEPSLGVHIPPYVVDAEGDFSDQEDDPLEDDEPLEDVMFVEA